MMWYYSFNNQPVGPVDVEALRLLFASGYINFDTLVWQPGMATWVHLSQTPIAGLMAAPVAYPPAWYPYVQQYTKPKRQGLRSLYIWWLALAASSILFLGFLFWINSGVSELKSTLAGWVYAVMCVSYIPLITAGVLQYILLYKFWVILQDGQTPTTPGRAVGFMFIPFFNFYWMFKAYWNLAKEQNRYIDRHFADKSPLQVRRSNIWLSLTYLIFSLVGALGYYIFSTFFEAHVLASAYNNSLPFFVFSFSYAAIIIGLMITMYIDLYMTSDSILSAEEAGVQPNAENE